MTGLDLIKASLRLLGFNETPTAEQSADALEALNLMMQGWQNIGDLALTQIQSFSVVSGTDSYVIGDGETWDGNAPVRVLKATLRDSNNIDRPVDVITDYEYMNIVNKSQSGTPYKLRYEKTGDTGKIYLYWVPQDSYTILLLNNTPFSTITLAGDIELPAGYLDAMKYNLTVEIAPEYENDPSGWVVNQANEKLNIVKRSNERKPRKIRFNGNRRMYNIETGTHA